jgi:hypothetical protein
MGLTMLSVWRSLSRDNPMSLAVNGLWRNKENPVRDACGSRHEPRLAK